MGQFWAWSSFCFFWYGQQVTQLKLRGTILLRNTVVSIKSKSILAWGVIPMRTYLSERIMRPKAFVLPIFPCKQKKGTDEGHAKKWCDMFDMRFVRSVVFFLLARTGNALRNACVCRISGCDQNQKCQTSCKIILAWVYNPRRSVQISIWASRCLFIYKHELQGFCTFFTLDVFLT